MPPAPVYKMCELYRGQERTPEDLEFDEEDGSTSTIPQKSQIVRPNAIPIEDFGDIPDAKHFPLQLCQGDCDFTEDCAPGLICHRRDANEDAPGCIGGEDLNSASDICIFDPFGPGYNVDTETPTDSPTKTLSPTVTPLPPKPATDFGSSPPLDAFPLQRCQGDCDTDSDCAEGLFCFQRNSNQAVPGCIGGETNPMMTDYCVVDPRGVGYTDPVTSSPTLTPTNLPTNPPTNPPTDLPTNPKIELTAVPTATPKLATEPPTHVPTAMPTTKKPTRVPTKPPIPFVPRPTGPKKEIWNRGWEPNFKLGECEGDCDNDTDCKPGLICFNRERSKVAVPGCLGGEDDTSLTDYCTYPPFEQIDQVSALIRDVSLQPTDKPTKLPTKLPTATPTDSPIDSDLIPLNGISWSPPRDQKLTLCEGDCDVDNDCADGLMCFQRFSPKTPVPGCAGGDKDSSLMDYCVVDKSTKPPIATSAPVPAPVEAPTRAPVPATTSAPVPDPTSAPVPVTVSDLVSITDSSTVIRNTPTEAPLPPPIECSKYDKAVNFRRFCDNDHVDMCCQSPRSNSNYCHRNYDIFGSDLKSACHYCCLETSQNTYEVGDANTPKDGLEPYTNKQCSELDNSKRICKEKSCCEPQYANTKYCQQQMSKYKDDWERICWSCCHPSKEFPEATSRKLLAEASAEADAESTTTAKTEEELRLWHRENPRELSPKDVRFNHRTLERELIVREENFGRKGENDEDAYFEEIHGEFQRRELQTPVMENYEDVHWWPYEWLLKVGTEYYYRYEGSMTVPPCYSVNHWRVMKDPIRVAKHQITELERLLAWRINDQCKSSTAGKPRRNNPDAVDVNRPLQELQKGHRMVFCECQDWPSKFPQERAWCDKWQKRDPELRLFQNPYNWPQNGF